MGVALQEAEDTSLSERLLLGGQDEQIPKKHRAGVQVDSWIDHNSKCQELCKFEG